jgi:hypothetical protein
MIETHTKKKKIYEKSQIQDRTMRQGYLTNYVIVQVSIDRWNAKLNYPKSESSELGLFLRGTRTCQTRARESQTFWRAVTFSSKQGGGSLGSIGSFFFFVVVFISYSRKREVAGDMGIELGEIIRESKTIVFGNSSNNLLL